MKPIILDVTIDGKLKDAYLGITIDGKLKDAYFGKVGHFGAYAVHQYIEKYLTNKYKDVFVVENEQLPITVNGKLKTKIRILCLEKYHVMLKLSGVDKG